MSDEARATQVLTDPTGWPALIFFPINELLCRSQSIPDSKNYAFHLFPCSCKRFFRGRTLSSRDTFVFGK